jgi:hypothetical protein
MSLGDGWMNLDKSPRWAQRLAYAFLILIAMELVVNCVPPVNRWWEKHVDSTINTAKERRLPVSK